MRTAEIDAIVEETLKNALGRGASEADAAARSRSAAARHPDFAEKYPKLLEMCCGSVTADQQASVRHFLPMMLAQLASVKRAKRSHGDDAAVAADALHDASVAVGQALADRYLPAATAATAHADADAAL